MKTVADVPGPEGLPLLGNVLQLKLTRIHRILERWADEFGGLYKIRLGPKPVLVISGAEEIQSILRNRPKLYRRLHVIEQVLGEMGINGVFSAEGAEWVRQRRITARAFDTAHVRRFLPVLVRITERLQARWGVAADTGETVDIQQDLMRYTVDVTTALAFGHDMNTLENKEDDLQRHLSLIFPVLNRRINMPFPYWRHFKLPADRAVDKALIAIRARIGEIVTRARERLVQNPGGEKTPENFLEAMLAASGGEVEGFTDDDIFGNVLTMLLAGEDTTANTMAWMVHFMTEHPEVQERMHAESSRPPGGGDSPEAFLESGRFDYIEAVASEAMRLKPVAPLLVAEPNEDVEISGISVRKGTALYLLISHAGMQDASFAGAGEFRPDRWLGNAGCPVHAHQTKAFIPFGAGPRFCPGRQLAMVEIKMVMAMLSGGFQVLKPEGALPVEEHYSFTLMPRNLRVRLKRREPDVPELPINGI